MSRPRDLTDAELNASTGSAGIDGQSVPVLQPPASGQAAEQGDSKPTRDAPGGGSGGAAADAGDAGAWNDSKQINALWSINEDRNSWVSVAGVGWVKLADNSESAGIALTVLGAHARQLNSSVSYGTDDTSGKLTQMYVW